MKLYGHNTDYARQQLVALSATYPVQVIRESDPNFATWFLCGEKPRKDCNDDCDCEATDKEFYFFTYKLACGFVIGAYWFKRKPFGPLTINAFELTNILGSQPKYSQENMRRHFTVKQLLHQLPVFFIPESLRPRRQHNGSDKGIRVSTRYKTITSTLLARIVF